MKSLPSRTLVVAARIFSAMTLVAATAGAVQAQPAYLSGPSIASAKQAAIFRGANFAPNSAVTVMVKAPSGTEAGFSAVTDAEGKLVYEFVPTENGMYSLRVVSERGKALASSSIVGRR